MPVRRATGKLLAIQPLRPLNAMPQLAVVDAESYQEQLDRKAERVRKQFAEFDPPAINVFPSPTEHYRLRWENTGARTQLVHTYVIRLQKLVCNKARRGSGLADHLSKADLAVCRAEFAVWHEGEDVFYVMYDRVSSSRAPVSQSSYASKLTCVPCLCGSLRRTAEGRILFCLQLGNGLTCFLCSSVTCSAFLWSAAVKVLLWVCVGLNC